MLKVNPKINFQDTQTFWGAFVVSILAVLLLITVVYGFIFWYMSSFLESTKRQTIEAVDNSLKEKSQIIKGLLDRRKSL